MISEKKNLFKSIDNSPFDDPFYLSISSLTQNKIKLRKDDLLEFEANLFLDRGRLVFRKSGKFYFTERGSDPAPDQNAPLCVCWVLMIISYVPSWTINPNGNQMTCAQTRTGKENIVIIRYNM